MSVLVHKEKRVLVTPDVPSVRQLFQHEVQEIPYKGSTRLVLPHTIPITKTLNAVVGWDIPAPVSYQYDWDGGTPFEVQKKTVAMLTMNPRAYVLNGLGTGKTKSALWAFKFLKQQGLADKMLVVAPLSTLNFTWAKEYL